MVSRPRNLLEFGRRVQAIVRRKDITLLAAAIAYYALVSVVPTLVLAMAIAVAVGGASFADRVATLSWTVLTPTGQAVLYDVLQGVGRRGTATVSGIIILVWGALKAFRGLDRSFSKLYGTSGRNSLLDGFIDAAIAFLGVAVAFGLMVVLGGILRMLPDQTSGWIAGMAVLLLGLFVAMLPVYIRFPDADVGIREAVPGTAVMALGWVALQSGFQAYVTFVSLGDMYGVLGGVLLLVTWFYLATILVLVGGVCNVVLADRDADRQAEKPAGRGL